MAIHEPSYIDGVLGCSTSSSTGGVGFGARHGCNMPAAAGDHEHHVRGGASVLPCHSNAPIAAFIDANVSGLCWCACAEHHKSQEKEGGCSRGTPVMAAPAVCGASCHSSSSCGHDHDVPTAALQLLMPRCATKDGASLVYFGACWRGWFQTARFEHCRDAHRRRKKPNVLYRVPSKTVYRCTWYKLSQLQEQLCLNLHVYQRVCEGINSKQNLLAVNKIASGCMYVAVCKQKAVWCLLDSTKALSCPTCESTQVV